MNDDETTTSKRKAPEFYAAEKNRRKAEEPVNVTRVSTAIHQTSTYFELAKAIFLRRAQDNMQE
jgi:hypothetical protein